MRTRRNQFLESQNCYYFFQFGFPLIFLTNNTLISDVENKLAPLENWHFVAGVLYVLE